MHPRDPFRVLLLAAGLSILPLGAQVAPGRASDLPREARPAVATDAATEVTLQQGRVFQPFTTTKNANAQMSGGAPKRMRIVLNYDDPNDVVVRPGDKDPVIDRRAPMAPEGTEAVARGAAGLTAPLKNFEGLNFWDHGSGWPPDTNGDVGIAHYIQTVNSSLGVFDKRTGALLASANFNDFFPEELGVPCDANNNGDPIILFDQIHKRWFLLNFAWTGTTNGSYYSIAASTTENPLGEWYAYCLKADNTLMDDYPKCGVWHDGIYISANMFAFGGSYQGSKLWAVKTPDLYSGTLKVQASGLILSLRSFSMMPSCARGSVPPPAGTPNYFFAIDANEFGGLHTDAMHIWQWKVDWTTPAKTLLTGPTIVPVAPYDLSASRVPQLGTTWTVDTLYGRLMYANIYRHHAWSQLPDGTLSRKPYGAFYLSHVAEYEGVRAMRWYEFRVQDGAYSIAQQGTFSPDGDHRWMGSVCADKWGNVGLGYSVGSSTMYPAIRYAGHRVNDPAGVMGQGEKSLVEGTGSQTRISRWGDYSMMTIDPVDDETFWYTQQYYTTSAVAPALPDWHTRIGAFKFTNLTSPIPRTPDKAIAQALDLPSQAFYNTGSTPLEVSTYLPYYGPTCVGAPASLADNGVTRLETQVTGPATVKFWWKVSSENGWDYLSVWLDGVRQYRISGEVAWTQVSLAIPAGTHTIAWTYIKDSADTGGMDMGWIDRVQILPAAATQEKGIQVVRE